MVSNRLEKMLRNVLALGMVALIAGTTANADDIEIYQATASSNDTRPQVLVVFDDSGSMSSVVVGQRPPYDPDATNYTPVHPGDRIYWSLNGQPPAMNSIDYFSVGVNRCAESAAPLAETGFFSTRAARWSAGGSIELCLPDGQCFTFPDSAGWKILQSGVPNPLHVECEADIVNGNATNPGAGNGFPQNTSASGQEYGPVLDGSLVWPAAYTFYSAHYMDWYHDSSLREDRTRLEIAQDVVANLVSANTAIDFGLALFNKNTAENDLNDSNDDDDAFDGGRIVQRLIPGMTVSERANLTTIVNGIVADGDTPLCETTMEAYRYLAGKSVVYGLEGGQDTPARDTAAESPPGTYDPPLQACAATYVILMTDGRPRHDRDANDAIEELTGKTCQNYLTDHTANPYRKSCLPELAEYMASSDLDGDASNGDQRAFTYTIGFALGNSGDELLIDTAEKGGGRYYPADTADQLAGAFRSAILEILATDTTFTSPAVAVDTFSRTESRNEVFFAMFKPDGGVDWPGNIKRLDIDFSSGSGVFIDKNGVAAIDPFTGRIKASATTLWSTGADGPDVLKGGVGALLAARNPASRKLYSNTGNNEALQPFGPVNMTASAFGFDNAELLYRYFGVNSQDEFNAVLNWGIGYDVSDEDGDGVTNEARPWILADMLHSKPVVVNYGARSGFSASNPDLRIVVGTNAGFLHMFGNNDGQEDWAFFAKELAPVLNERRANALSSQHVYGIDAPVVLFTQDLDKNGTIDSTAGDKAYLYFGLRRGGRIIYALDISDPDNPAMLWRIDATMAGFSELGQTWSVPVLTRVAGYNDDLGLPKPVLVFGAGYDTNKDSRGVVTPDSMGRGIFIVDAVTGALVWSMTPAVDSATNMQEAGLLHSVAADLTVFDSNGDGLSDRIYFADTGGQVWRVDMPGASLPDISQDRWRAVKIAAVNGGTAATDRRFFNAPDIVRTTHLGTPFDAILIGSGDRTNPNDRDNPDDSTDPAVDNQFYMFRDLAITPYFSAAPSEADCSANPPSVDFRCQLPLTPADLYDITDNNIQNPDQAVQAAAQAGLATASGWRMDLRSDGEKSLSKSITIAGKVYFTTFTPDPGVENMCAPGSGKARLYTFALPDASDPNVLQIGTIIPDTLSMHVDSDGEIWLIPPWDCPDCDSSGSGGGGGDLIDTGESLRAPYGTYWYREDY